jgi:TonB-dependent starch-binding outer membrane protein SusC
MDFKALFVSSPDGRWALTKTWRIMRLTALFLFIACLHVSARSWSQTVTLTERNASLQDIFKAIHQQTGYQFFYEDALLDKAGKVSIIVKNAPIDEVLVECLRDLPITFSIVNKTIVVKEKPAVVAPVAGPPPPNDIHGRVTDSLGNPLAGASVTVKGTSKGTQTDGKGEFVLKGVGENAVLVVSFTGYNPETVKLSGVSVAVVLHHNNDPLDQVQVIAYGTTTERLSTGNTTTIKGEDIEKQPVSNVLLALEGQVPGLFVTQSNGLSGAGVTVRVQGQNSIQNGNDPLYVVDGVPYASFLPATGQDAILGSSGDSYVNSSGSPFSYLDPSEIASIDVLKDADATAIYGSRAANGAILITTKKGKAGPVRFNLNLQQGVGEVAHHLNVMNTQQYLEMRNEGFKNDGITPDPNKDYDLLLWDTTRNTDWQKTLIGGTANYTNVTGNLSGGTALTQYLIGGTYHRETTVFPGDFNDRKASLHFNLNSISLNQRFHFQFTGNYMLDNNQLPQSDLTTLATQLEPDAPVLHNADGSLNWAPTASGVSTWTNPLVYQYINYQNKTTNIVSNAVLSYNILPGLDIRSSFGYTSLITNDYTPYPLISVRPENRPFTNRSADYGDRNLNSWIIEPQAQYKRFIARGKLDILAGATVQQNTNSRDLLVGSGYSSDQILHDISAAATISGYGSIYSQYKYVAGFGRINYNWADKYILDLNVRRDGSSRFGAQNRFHDFGSVGLAWVFSEEEPLKNNSILSFGKFRASYGTTGNDQIGDYNFLSLYNVVYNAGLAYQNSTALAPSSLPNPYLQWEETRKLQAGIDLGFFKNRILLNASYAFNRSSNELLSTPLPSTVGFTYIAQNFPATVQNTSLELLLSTTNIKTKSFTWTSRVNLTVPRNKLVSFPDIASSTYSTRLIVGQPITISRNFHYAGVDPTTGQYQFLGVHGLTFSPNAPDDETVNINLAPKFYGGFQNSFTYKSIQLDFLLQFVKQKGFYTSYWNGSVTPGVFESGNSNQPVSVLDRWTQPGDKAAVEAYSTNFNYNIYNALTSDYSYGDASFVRLKNLSMSWSLPGRWVKDAHLQNPRIFVQAQNLFTVTPYKGLDPESQSTVTLPPLRIMTIGFQTGL